MFQFLRPALPSKPITNSITISTASAWQNRQQSRQPLRLVVFRPVVNRCPLLLGCYTSYWWWLVNLHSNDNQTLFRALLVWGAYVGPALLDLAWKRFNPELPRSPSSAPQKARTRKYVSYVGSLSTALVRQCRIREPLTVSSKSKNEVRTYDNNKKNMERTKKKSKQNDIKQKKQQKPIRQGKRSCFHKIFGSN